MVLACLAVMQNIIKSKHGRAITSIRDNEIAARAMGINVTKYKLIVFTISAFFAGAAGVFYSYSQFNVQSDKFGYNYSIEILVMVVLGGMGNINGAILSAALITYLNNKLASVLTGEMAVMQNLIYSLILVLIVIYNNAPGLRGFREKYNLSVLTTKMRRKTSEHHEGEDSAQWARIPTKIKMDEILSTDIIVKDTSKPDKREDGGKR
jgi:branched-chain amino acid transport system permease protein